MSEQSARYQRSAGGLIAALVVLTALVGAFVGVRALLRAEPEATVREVDYQQALRFAQEQADFRIAAPGSLPDGWRATSVRFTPSPTSWHLGLLTDEGRYVGVEQSRAPERRLVETHVDEDASPTGRVSIAGEVWNRWSDENGDTGLSRTEGAVTTLVVGTPDLQTLKGFVETLG